MTATATAPASDWTTDAAYVAEVRACLRFRHTAGLGPRTWKRIFSRYETATLALAEARSLASQGLCQDAVAGALVRGVSTPAVECEIEAAAAKGLLPLPYHHPAYPALLRDLPDPPALLYVVGDAGLLAGPCVAMVGARQCSRYGFAAAFDIAAGLADAGITVVSGLAFGIDRQAHLGGLTGPGRSVAVLGTGLDLVYPDANLDVWRELASHGAVVSEFAPGTPPQAQNFPIRNRIIAGVSLGVMVVEAAARSGSLITARLALDQGREVFALPGPVTLPTYAGCHRLLGEGAHLVQTAEDIVKVLSRELARSLDSPRPRAPGVPRGVPAGGGASSRDGSPEAGATGTRPTPPESAGGAASLPRDLSETEAAVLGRLVDDARVHIDALARELDVAAGALNHALILLEMKGLVRKLPGMYYTSQA